MKRKTSTLPTRIYKYALRPPTENADLVAQSFEDARAYYNQLVTIENRRRLLYRRARARIFPEIGRLEAEYAEHEKTLEALMLEIRAAKSKERSRAVPADLEARVAGQKLAGKAVSKQLSVALAERKPYADAASLLKSVSKSSEEGSHTPAAIERIREDLRGEYPLEAALEEAASSADAEASAAIKSLRPTLYWGTYLLVEKAVKVASSSSPGEVGYNLTPPHLLSNRIGVHWAGGASVGDVLSDDTLMQVRNPPEHRQTKSGIWRPRYQHAADGTVIRCTLRFRVGSTPDRKPVWTEFPLSYDRPMPPDARIKDAYVKRSRLREVNPWQYHLCVVLESESFERVVPGTRQEGKTSVNFGWRQMEDGGIRVATVNREGETPTFIELPARWVTGFAKCRQLQSLLDEKFEAVKKELGAWITTHESELPDAFKEAFEHLALWRSQHKLCEVTRYWKEHRLHVPSDADIWPAIHEWRGRYLHLHDWQVNQRRHLLRWRDDFYRCRAKELATTSTQVVLDTFRISAVARRAPDDEVEEGGQIARYNRTLAAPSELRETITTAASKYHCEVVAAPTVNGTRRCNNCGHESSKPITKLNHQCSNCPASWDQDVNNTDNLHDASARGEVLPLVRPAEKAENGDFQESQTVGYGAARKRISNR
jgi:hypothetical protein